MNFTKTIVAFAALLALTACGAQEVTSMRGPLAAIGLPPSTPSTNRRTQETCYSLPDLLWVAPTTVPAASPSVPSATN